MLVRFLKNHTPYLAGETASFPAAQAATFVAKGVAMAVASDALDGNAGGPLIPSEQVTEGLDSLLAGFRQRGIEVDHATPIGELVSHAASIVAAERNAYEAAKAEADAATGSAPGGEDTASGIAPTSEKPAAETKPEPEASEGPRRTVTPPRVAKGAQ
ncbi:hypothetical protein [Azospirillum sp. Sh1]|uniref:hypothetical protein n=1 Tax=Azospirillum sp. Sh1 TaxID=2607285 RepID=UPI0011F0707A|nr:hypothetical protein [Azospirillum sp. Sh1]KAA0576682.1 hypothetical protein FZ029_12510 [Azospirillum sp. Sh1]